MMAAAAAAATPRQTASSPDFDFLVSLLICSSVAEVAQQSKAQHKDDFVTAFLPVIAEATATAYKGAPSQDQGKLRKVVVIWRERSIFEAPIQAAVEARVEELEKVRGAAKAGSRSSNFRPNSSSAIPFELSPLAVPQQKVSELLLSTGSEVSAANQGYDKLHDPANPIPAAPVYAARLNGFLKKLATAEDAVHECVKARTELIGALEKLLSANRAELAADEAQLAEFASRRTTVAVKKHDVELAIMSGFASNDSDQVHRDGGSTALEPVRPEVEALTPPPADKDTEPINNGTPNTKVASPLANLAYASPVAPQQPTFQAPSGPEAAVIRFRKDN